VCAFRRRARERRRQRCFTRAWCRRTCAARRAWTRCCHGCTCTACPPATCRKPLLRSWVPRRLGSRPRWWRGSRVSGWMSIGAGAARSSAKTVGCICGSTASTRGLTIPPRLAVGDGALGFWAALREIYPETRQQRCWVHKTANVLNYLPKSLQPKAKAALHEIWMAATKAQALVAFEQFVAAFGAKYPKAVECLVKDRETLLAFYDFPAEHWIHIRTSNAIELTFATVRHRTERTKGCLTRDGMLSMIFKLGMSAEKNWRRLRGFEWLAKVIDGVKFRDGIEVQQRVRKAGNQALRRIAA